MIDNNTIRTTVNVWEALGRAIALRRTGHVYDLIDVVEGWVMDPTEQAEIIGTCERVAELMEAEGY